MPVTGGDPQTGTLLSLDCAVGLRPPFTAHRRKEGSWRPKLGSRLFSGAGLVSHAERPSHGHHWGSGPRGQGHLLGL